MNFKAAKAFLFRVVLWLLLAIILPLSIESLNFVWISLPYYYVVVCVFLCLFYELSFFLFRRKRYFSYLLVLTCCYFLFPYLHQLLSWLDLGEQFESLFRLQKLRLNYISHNMFRVVVAASIVHHLVILRRERQEILAAKMQAELSMLQAQITPHFFFNSLNTIYSLALSKSDKAPDAIITLSDMMRYVLTDAKKDWISLSQEADYLQRYVELQELRLPRKTTLHHQLELEGDYMIPPMLLVTFYENAFKYGTSSQTEQSIDISLTVKDATLCLTTYNAIVVEKSPEKSTGNGIANTRRRLELLYPDRHELAISECNGFYHLKLIIQLS